MTFGEMTTIQFFRPAGRWRENCMNTCRNLLLMIVGWLAGVLGMRLVDREAKLLPDGCRIIPAGHFNFDPAMVEFFGGKDGLNKAVVYQRFMAWIESNRLAGRNMWNGQPHTYNTYEQWADDVRIFHPKTIQKHVRDFEAMGLLSSHQPWKAEGKCVKHYTSPLRLADNPQQMLPGWEDKTPRVGAEDSVLITTHQPTTHKPSTRKAKTPTPTAWASRFKTAGGVGIFPNHIPDFELPEKKSEIPEARPESDEHEQFTDVGKKVEAAPAQNTPLVPQNPPFPVGDEPTDQDESTPLQDFLRSEIETQSSGNTPVVDVPEWMPSFFTGCTHNELLQLLRRFGEDTLQSAKKYAQNPANGVDKPAGFVRARLASGWRPPAGEGAKSYHQDWMGDPIGEMRQASTERLREIVADDSIQSLHKVFAQKELEDRERASA